MSERTFLLSDAATAAGVTVQVVRMWLKRKTIWFDETEMQTAPVNGLPHQITFTSVMRIAIMGKLLGLGMSPSAAWTATRAFTDKGEGGSSVHEDGQDIPAMTIKRYPGGFYPEGYTVLQAYDDPVRGIVTNVFDDTPMKEVFFPKGLESGKRKAAVAVVNISFVRLEVRQKLNID